MDEPDTLDGGDGTRLIIGCFSRLASASTGELLLLLLLWPGGLKLSPNRLPVRSRPRSRSSSTPLPLRLRSRPSRVRTPAKELPFTMPIALPVGEMLPIGELVPRLQLLLLLPDRSRSENDDVRVEERPRELDAERESLEWYDEDPVVVLPLTLGECGWRPRTTSAGERRSGSAHNPDVGVDDDNGAWQFGIDEVTKWACGCEGVARGTGTGTVAVGDTEGESACGCSYMRYGAGTASGLLSLERSARSSIAPLTSLTTTTGISASGVRGESIGLGLGLVPQARLRPFVTLAAPPSA